MSHELARRIVDALHDERRLYRVNVSTAGSRVANDPLPETASEDHEETGSPGIPWLRPPFLYELYAQPPRRRGAGGRRYLSKDEQRYMAYRFAESESCRAISDAVWIPEGTVRSFRRRVLENAGLLLDCEFVMRVQLGDERSTRRWFCRYCGALLTSSVKAGRHALDHLR